MDKTKGPGVVRAIAAGVIAASLIVFLIGFAIWLYSFAGIGFGAAFLLVMVLVSLSVILGYFASSESTVIGFIGRWKQELAILFPPPPDEDDVLRDVRRTRDVFAWIIAGGLAAIVIYAMQWNLPGFAHIFGNALLLALAALVSGLFFGFLFGIPRTLQENEPAAAATGTASAATPTAAARRTTAARLGVNTNLEQISDWLTKIIVGLGLIHLKDAPGYVNELLGLMVRTLNGDRTFVLAILVTFSVTGFLLGYLLTRLYLTRALARALLRAEQTAEMISRELARVAADIASSPPAATQGPDAEPVSTAQKAAAEKLEQVAQTVDKEQLRAELSTLVREYENIRLTRDASPERTRLMEVVAGKMRALSLALYDQLPTLMASTSTGERLAAVVFLQVKPSPQHLPWLEQRFAIEKPFIFYHAAWALRQAARQLPLSDLPAVLSAVTRVQAFLSTQPLRDTGTEETIRAALKEGQARTSEP